MSAGGGTLATSPASGLPTWQPPARPAGRVLRSATARAPSAPRTPELALFEDAERVRGQLAWLQRRGKGARLAHEVEQLRLLRQWFEDFDVDGSGRVKTDELAHPLMAMGFVDSRAALDRLLARYAIAPSGRSDEGIAFAGFVRLVRAFDGDSLGGRGRNPMRALFRAACDGSLFDDVDGGDLAEPRPPPTRPNDDGASPQSPQLVSPRLAPRRASDAALAVGSISLLSLTYARREMLAAHVGTHDAERRARGQRMLTNLEPELERRKQAELEANAGDGEVDGGLLKPERKAPAEEVPAVFAQRAKRRGRRPRARAAARTGASQD